MRALVQRVAWAEVESDGSAGKQTGRIAEGLLVYVGVAAGDTTAEADWLAEKVTNLRIFEDEQGQLNAGSGWSELFIYPGYEFKVIDGLLTNFHLPRSTLLMLVCAFAERQQVLAAYQEAVQRRYRFYSYGDCMLLL